MYSILDINIQYHSFTKKTINLKITKLQTQEVGKNNFVAFETNITDISPVITDYFTIRTNRNEGINCLFKTNSDKNNNKLLLLCLLNNPGESYLKNIKLSTLRNINAFILLKSAPKTMKISL